MPYFTLKFSFTLSTTCILQQNDKERTHLTIFDFPPFYFFPSKFFSLERHSALTKHGHDTKTCLNLMLG